VLRGMGWGAGAESIETQHRGSVPAFLAKPGSEAVSLALALTGANATSTVSYGTEAGLFEEAGCPTVICGPGDIEQAHMADEFVGSSQLDGCMSFLSQLTETLTSYLSRLAVRGGNSLSRLINTYRDAPERAASCARLVSP